MCSILFDTQDQVKTYKCWVLKNAETFAEGQVVMQGLDCFARNVTQHFKDRYVCHRCCRLTWLIDCVHMQYVVFRDCCC